MGRMCCVWLGILFRVVAHKDRPGSHVESTKGVADLRGAAVVYGSAELAATMEDKSPSIGIGSWSFS